MNIQAAAKTVIRALALIRHAYELRMFKARQDRAQRMGYAVPYGVVEIAAVSLDPDTRQLIADYEARQAIRAKVGLYRDRVARGELRITRAMYTIQ